MSTRPEFKLPNGEYQADAVLTTTVDSRFISGRFDESSVIGLEVSIRGSVMVADPDLITIQEGIFVIPNPEAYPEGLILLTGSNPVAVRAQFSGGGVSEVSTLVATLVAEGTIGLVANAPSSIKAESFDGYVNVSIRGLPDSNVYAYNVYASTIPGGGGEGYNLINLLPLETPAKTRYQDPLGTLDSDAVILKNEDGGQLVDPLLLQFRVDQTDLAGVSSKTEINESLPVPDGVDEIHIHAVVEAIRYSEEYSFKHTRSAGTSSLPPTIQVGEFASISVTDPLFYVTTALYRDPVTGVEVESPFSPEIQATPVYVKPITSGLPSVSREKLLKQTALALYKSDPLLSIQPGSVIRDLFVDPFLTEATRMRIMIDYMHRASSFTTLLAIDDPTGSGISVAVHQSNYKKGLADALFMSPRTVVQSMINAAFDKLASNFGVVRGGGRHARGEVTFYTTSLPAVSIIIPLGSRVRGGGRMYRTVSGVSLPAENAASYYNPSTGEYAVTVGVRATSSGAGGNVASGSITTTDISGLKCRNDDATFGGTDGESNQQLAIRAQRRLASVDSGTYMGYFQNAAMVPGVEQIKVVASGDLMMQRDLDDTGVHRGGKVDVWVRGEQKTTATDTFSFTFETAREVQFELTSAPDLLEFIALDSSLSQQNPIIEMLNTVSPKLGIRNASTGEYFDLVDVEITGYNTIRLSTEVDQPPVDYGDIVLGDYRYRTGTEYVLERQPVSSVTSVSGSVSGSLDDQVWTLVRPHPPLTRGRSPSAAAYIQVSEPDNVSGLVVPSGELISVEDETHVVIGEYIEYLASLGAIGLTVVVTSADGFTTYKGPYDPSGEFDYTIVEGDQTTPLGIQRVEGGGITDGDTVLISYQHDENFVVTYTTNMIVSVTQTDMDAKKHLSADILVKEAVSVPVDITATVVVKRGSSSSTADAAIRTSLANLFAGLGVGDSLRHSDVVHALDASSDVSYVIVPITKLAIGDGSQVIREILPSDQFADQIPVDQWSTQYAVVNLLKEPLSHSTSEGGGPESGNYTGIWADDDPAALMPDSPHLLGVAPGQAYIIGSAGLVIPGVSDDDTIKAEGYVTESEIARRREELTANRILVSLAVGDTPADHTWSATYTSYGDEGAADLEIGPSSYFVAGTFTFTYDEDRTSTRFFGSSGSSRSSTRSNY